MTDAPADACDAWLEALEARHLASLRFSEVSRALRALSATYVERRDRLLRGAALDGGGKRAAFALFYGPLHYFTIRHIARALGPPHGPIDTLVDLGCGSGAAGAAWATLLGGRTRVLGVDRHQWAVAEASWTYRQFGLRARVLRGDAGRLRLPTRRTALLAGWLVNEVSDDQRHTWLDTWLDAAARGAAVLVVEPIARSAAPWWGEWTSAFTLAGGRADEWRVAFDPPDIVRRLDRAAGLSHRELTARSLWLDGSRRRATSGAEM